MELALFSVRWIQEILLARWLENGKTLSMHDVEELSWRYAREVEHSDDNLNALEDWLFETYAPEGCVLEEEQAEIQAGKLTEKQVEKVFSVGDFPEHFYHSVHCRSAVKEDFQIKVENRSAVFAEVNVIKISDFGTATTPVTRRLSVKNGYICWKEAGLSPGSSV